LGNRGSLRSHWGNLRNCIIFEDEYEIEGVYEIEGIYNIIYVPETRLAQAGVHEVRFAVNFRRDFGSV
jgi:hypothetical protein